MEDRDYNWKDLFLYLDGFPFGMVNDFMMDNYT